MLNTLSPVGRRRSSAEAGADDGIATDPAPSPTRAAWQRRCDRGAFGCLVAAIVIAPWPLGSNRPWAVALLAVLVWAGLLAGMTAAALVAEGDDRLDGGSGITRRSLTSLVPLGCLALFAALQVAQLIPGLGAEGGTISVDPFHTRFYLLTTAVYIGAWLLVRSTVRTEARLVRLMAALVAAGALQAFAAVALYSTGWHYTFLFAPFEQGGRATGTFPSPDNLAGYLELCLSAALGWMLAQFSADDAPKGRGWRAGTVGALAFIMSGKMLLRLVMVGMVVALVMTHSRMGNSAFFMALAVAAVVVSIGSKRLRKPAIWLVVSMTLIDIVIVGQWVGLDRVVQRLQDTAASSTAASGFGLGDLPAQREESIQDRLRTPLQSLGLVAQRPWLGHGGGTYATAFPPFKQPGAPVQAMYWDHAHDDYVQVAADMGLVGLAAWLGIGISTLWRAARLLGDAQNRHLRGMAAGCIMAVCCMGPHSVVDFNLHIPAIALTFTVMLAAVWSMPRSQGSRRRRRSVPGEEGA